MSRFVTADEIESVTAHEVINSNMAAAMETAQQAETFGENGLTGLDDNALGGILQSLEAFKG